LVRGQPGILMHGNDSECRRSEENAGEDRSCCGCHDFRGCAWHAVTARSTACSSAHGCLSNTTAAACGRHRDRRRRRGGFLSSWPERVGVKVARWRLAGHRGREYSANLPTLRSPLPARWSRANGSQRKGRPLALRGWGGRGTGMGKSGNRGSNSHGDAGSRASNGQAAGSHGDAWGQGMSVLSTTEPDRRRDRVALGQRAPAMSDRTPEQRARKRGPLDPLRPLVGAAGTCCRSGSRIAQRIEDYFRCGPG
jgi:hypothetical protein